MELPLREQGTLLTAVRGCDVAAKYNEEGGVVDTPERRLTGWIRWSFMNPADPREVDIPGAFFQSVPPGWRYEGDRFIASAFGHYPLHWVSHVMHALKVISVRHPNPETCARAETMYLDLVTMLHLNPERDIEMIQRLSRERYGTDEVVS